MMVTGWVARSWSRLRGFERYRDPRSYFGPGGLDEAAALCAEANRDLLAFVRPPRSIEPEGWVREGRRTRGDGVCIEEWTFVSPKPSGVPANDRVWLRLYRPQTDVSAERVVLFHHPMYQYHWALWEWFLSDVIRRIPVAMMVGPNHGQRAGAGRFSGEGTCNSNPARLFEAIRQWCWDHQAAVQALRGRAGLQPAAEIGFSLGAFQMLVLASAGRIDVPLVSISSTNRYAYGLTQGISGKGLLKAMRRAGVDERRLFELTASVELERYVHRLHGKPVMYIRGCRDWVDPPPSLDRLERALQPARSLTLPAGHATVLRFRRRIFREVLQFLAEQGVRTA